MSCIVNNCVFVLIRFILFQCRCPVSPFKMTLHIVAHYAKTTEEDVGRHLFTFVVKHREWITRVGGKLLAKKKLDLDEYLSNLYLCLTPVDQLGLLILAHLYHRHFAVFLKNGVWTTRRNNSMQNCKIYFVYKGAFVFSDTVYTNIPPALKLSVAQSPKATARISPPPIECTPSPVAEESDSDSGSGSSRSHSNSPSTLPVKTKLVEIIADSPPPKRKRYTVITCYRRPRSVSQGKAALGRLAVAQANREKEKKLVEQTKQYIDKKSQEFYMLPKKEISGEELRLLCLQNRYNLKPLSIVLQQCDVAKEQNNLAGNNGNQGDLNGGQVEKGDSSESEQNKGDLNAANKADLIPNDNNENQGDLNGGQVEKGDSSESEQNKGDLNAANKADLIPNDNNEYQGDLNGGQVDQKSENIANRTRSKKPKNSLQEPDPLLAAFKENNPEELDALLQEDGKKVNGSCIIDQEDLNTHDGEINIKTYGIWHSKKKKKNLQCPDSACNQVFDFVKDMNVHVTGAHPDLRFRCQYCPKSYLTYNARYKHEHKHFELLYCCHYCSMRFLFPGLREKHEHQHTQKGLLPCTWPECKQMLSCKDALRQHINTHTDQRHKCEKCPKDFNTLTNLRQHEKGAHGEGFISLCGAAFDWSDSRNEHQGECFECGVKKKEKLNQPKYPYKRKQWKRVYPKMRLLHTFGEKTTN